MSRQCESDEGAKEVAHNLDTDQEKGLSQMSNCVFELMLEANTATREKKKSKFVDAVDEYDQKGVGADLVVERDSGGKILNFEVHGNSRKP